MCLLDCSSPKLCFIDIPIAGSWHVKEVLCLWRINYIVIFMYLSYKLDFVIVTYF